MPSHVPGDGRLTHPDAQLLELAVDPRCTPERIRRRQLTNQGAHFAGTPGRPVRCRLFQVQNKRKPRRCQPTTVSGLTMCTAERQPRHACESHAQSIRSTGVRRRRGRRDRFRTAI